MARRGVVVGGLLVAAHLTAAAWVRAAPARALVEAIEVESSECLSRETLASKTASFLQRTEIDARISMTVTMSGSDASFELSRSGAVVGERLVPRRNLACQEFLSVVAAALAVAIDAALLAEERAPEETPVEPPPAAPPAPERERPRAPARRPPPPPRPKREARPWSVALSVEPAVLAGLHEPTFGGALGTVLARHSLGRAGLSMFATLPVETDLGARHVRVGLIAGRFDACLAPPFRKVPIAPCVAATLGAHRAEPAVASSSASSASDSTLWGALGAGPEMTVAFRRWTVFWRVEPWWVLRPSRVVTALPDGTELSKTAPQFGLAGFLGARWSIL